MPSPPMISAVAAATVCALASIAAGGPESSALAWTLYCAEPIAAVLAFAVARSIQGRRDDRSERSA